MKQSNVVSGKITLNQMVNRIETNGAVFNIHYWGAMPEHFNTLCHKHSFFEVCYVVEREGVYIDGNRTYPLQGNTIFMSRPGVSHQLKSEYGLFLVHVAFELVESESSQEWIKIMEDAKRCKEVVVKINEENIAAMLWKSLYIQAAKTKHPFLKEVLTSLAGNLILSLIETFVPLSQNNKTENIMEPSSSPLLKQVKLHIRDNLSGSLKLIDVASHFHVSSRHLSRLFVSELGVNYSEFVQNERIQKAIHLLKATDLSISDISEECGFSTVHYFTRVFTSIMRDPPGRFRSLYTNLNTTAFSDY